MPVTLIAEVPALTEDVYGGMIQNLKPRLQAADGFIAHSGGPSPNGGWRVVEIWDTEEQAQTWFEANVRPNLPDGVVPDRQFYEAHTAFGG